MQNVNLSSFAAVVKEINLNSTGDWTIDRWKHYRGDYVRAHPDMPTGEIIPDPPPRWRVPYGFTWGIPYVIVGAEGADLFLLDDNNDIRQLSYAQIKLIHTENLDYDIVINTPN